MTKIDRLFKLPRQMGPGAEAMAAQRRFSLLLSPAGIVVGYPVVLVALAGGLLAFPFSGIFLGLFAVLVGTFLIVAIPVLLIVYVFMTIALARAFIGIGRRLLGVAQDSESKPMKKKRGPRATDSGLWDRWIDGSW
jgi:hypothetical protein